MNQSSVLIVTFLLFVSPVSGQGSDATPGNPPVVLIAAEIDKDDALVLVQYKTIYIQPTEKGGGGPIYNERSQRKVPLKDVFIFGTDGKQVTVDVARKRLGGKEAPILVSSWGEEFPPFYRKLFRDDALLFVFPKDAPTWRAIEAPELSVRK